VDSGIKQFPRFLYFLVPYGRKKGKMELAMEEKPDM